MRFAVGVIGQAFKIAYDAIGVVILANVVWCLAVFSPILLVGILRVSQPYIIVGSLAFALLLFGPASAGVHFMMNRLVNGGETTIADFGTGFTRFFSRGALLVLVNALIAVILVVDLIWVLNSDHLIVRLLAGVFVYFILFWLLFIQYVFPLLVEQNIGVVRVMKRAVLVAVDNLGMSFMLAGAVALLGVFSVLTTAPFLLLFVSVAALIQNFALVEILKKYDSANGR